MKENHHGVCDSYTKTGQKAINSIISIFSQI